MIRSIGNHLTEGRGFDSWCASLFDLGWGSVARLCNLNQSRPSSEWVPGEILE